MLVPNMPISMSDDASRGGEKPIGQKPEIQDFYKVRAQDQRPIFRKVDIRDAGKVRLGGQGPLFR